MRSLSRLSGGLLLAAEHEKVAVADETGVDQRQVSLGVPAFDGEATTQVVATQSCYFVLIGDRTTAHGPAR